MLVQQVFSGPAHLANATVSTMPLWFPHLLLLRSTVISCGSSKKSDGMLPVNSLLRPRIACSIMLLRLTGMLPVRPLSCWCCWNKGRHAWQWRCRVRQSQQRQETVASVAASREIT